MIVRTHAESWHAKDAFRAGDRVIDVRDPRFTGRVDAALSTGVVVVTWENGWKSDIHARHLRFDPDVPRVVPTKPTFFTNTIVPSPKRLAGLS